MFSDDDLSVDVEVKFGLTRRAKAKILQYFEALGPGAIELACDDGGTVRVRNEQEIVRQVENYVKEKIHAEQKRAKRNLERSAIRMLEERMRRLDNLYREDDLKPISRSQP